MNTEEMKLNRFESFKQKVACIEGGKQIDKIKEIFSGHLKEFQKKYKKEDVENLKKTTKVLLSSYHFGFGMSYRNQYVWKNFDMWSGLCFFHPDDVSSAFIEFAYNSLNNKEMNVMKFQRELIESYATGLIRRDYNNPVCGNRFRKIPSEELYNITVDCGKEYIDRYWDFDEQSKKWSVSRHKTIEDSVIEEGIAKEIEEYLELKKKKENIGVLAEKSYMIFEYYRAYGKIQTAKEYLNEYAEYLKDLKQE